jgi:hypothetical protein
MIIWLGRGIFPLVFAIVSLSAYMHAPLAYGQRAGNQVPNAAPADGQAAQNPAAPRNKGGTLEERLLGGPQAYQETYGGQGGRTTAGAQTALTNAEDVRPTTPTDRMLTNEATKTRPQSLVTAGSAALRPSRLTKDAAAKQVRTPGAAAQTLYPGSADPANAPKHPIYKSPW